MVDPMIDQNYNDGNDQGDGRSESDSNVYHPATFASTTMFMSMAIPNSETPVCAARDTHESPNFVTAAQVR